MTLITVSSFCCHASLAAQSVLAWGYSETPPSSVRPISYRSTSSIVSQLSAITPSRQYPEWDLLNFRLRANSLTLGVRAFSHTSDNFQIWLHSTHRIGLVRLIFALSIRLRFIRFIPSVSRHASLLYGGVFTLLNCFTCCFIVVFQSVSTCTWNMLLLSLKLSNCIYDKRLRAPAGMSWCSNDNSKRDSKHYPQATISVADGP